MLEIGRYHQVEVLRLIDAGAIVGTDEEGAELLLPGWEVPRDVTIGMPLTIFAYTDSEDRPVATLQTPAVALGGFAALEVIDATPHGVFLDWGLPKDLFSPWALQFERLAVGQRAVVHVLLDERTNRLVATTRLAPHFGDGTRHLKPGQPVQALVYDYKDIGTLVVLDGRFGGLLYDAPHARRPRVGDTLDAYVAKVREDGRVDVTTRPPGRSAIHEAQIEIVRVLLSRDGFMPLHDKSPPGEIRARLGMSKKVFKQAVGALYKSGRITLEADGIRLRAPR